VIPTATELLLALDAQRPRTLQAEMGMSSLGDCRRRAGYHAQGYPADPQFKESGIQAMLGTAIHEALAAAARLMVPGAHAEDLEVSFAGLKGHPDLYVARTVRDYKTNGYSMQLANRRQLGPKLAERWQSHTYGAALTLAGYPVDTVQIDYVARDSGDEFLFTEPFDVQLVADAMRWLKDIRETDVSLLPRDFRPDSATCKGCKYFRRCWDAEPGTDDRHALFAEDPDAARWAARLENARARKKAADHDEADAKGALDHLRLVQRPGEREDIIVPGYDKVIRFTVKKGRSSPDMAQIANDYKRAGARPPFRYGQPTIGVELVKRKEDKTGE
jgi:hypothetical protein